MGVEKGRTEGITEGRLEERRSMIVMMLSQGLSPEQISSFTGLTLSDVNALIARK